MNKVWVITLLGAWLLGLAIAPVQAQNVNDGFDPNADGDVARVALQPDGKIVVVGSFGHMGGQPRVHLVRLLADGSVDPTFAATGVGGSSVGMQAVAIQPDGKTLIAGSFSAVGSYVRNNLARLNADGSVDTAFDPSVTGTQLPNVNVSALVLQADGKIIIGGSFNMIGAMVVSNIARLNADGSVDPSFSPNADALVAALVPQPDGKLVLGGAFGSVDGATRHSMARVNSDGSLDTAFDPDVQGVCTHWYCKPTASWCSAALSAELAGPTLGISPASMRTAVSTRRFNRIPMPICTRWRCKTMASSWSAVSSA